MRLRRDGIAWRELDGAGVLLDLRSSQYLSTNAVGTLILGLLQEDRSPSELMDAVADAYDVERHVVERDVEDFLAELRSKDLIDA